MDKLIIQGGQKLKGEVKISGAKNAVLPILAACLLTDQPSCIRNVPALNDVTTMLSILCHLGVKVECEKDIIRIFPKKFAGNTAPYELVSTMRASICVLGPLLAKKGDAKVSLPGGCVIGARPIDLHIKGLRALGADIKVKHGYIIAKRKGRLKGRNIYLGGCFGSSVLATTNVIMAAVLADGVTIIENAACEPEIVDLCDFLTKMGAKIKGRHTPLLKIEGVKSLSGADHTVIPDRIETGTFMIASAITGGKITLKGARLDHLGAVVDKLSEAGVKISTLDSGAVKVYTNKTLKPVNVTTLPYPGFPTDMQAQIMSLMSITEGISVVTEKIYPDRFMHVSEYGRMGAQIMLERPNAIIHGISSLSGAKVMASDLRASAGLVLAGLVAKGKTEIQRIYHIDRGYEKIEEKLQKLGAKIKRVKEK